MDKVETIKIQKNPIKFIVARLLMRLKLSKYFITNLDHYSLRFYPTSLSMALWLDSNYAHTANYFFKDYLQKGDTVLDIGANIGTVTIECALNIGNSGKVYSFEANPTIFDFLKGNIKLNNLNNIQICNFAVGNKNGTIKFSNKRSDDQNSVIESSDGLKLPIKRLDDLPIKESSFDLMKIDVLGYEKFVFEGAKKILSKTKCIHFPAIQKDYEKYGYNFEYIKNFLVGQGFQIFSFNNNGGVSRIEIDYQPKNEDLLAIKDLDDFTKRISIGLSNR